MMEYSEGMKYPWPSTMGVANFVTMKPCIEGDERSDFMIWKKQMLCLLESHELSGFVDGEILPPPEDEEQQKIMWRRRDMLVQGWILGSIGKDALDAVWDKPTAREIWLELETFFKEQEQDVDEEEDEEEHEEEEEDDGDSNDNNMSGMPLLLEKTTFILFAISDAVSLFASITSLLMFLSILTSRYAEEDFLYVLPKRLSIGLLSLFVSITFMMVAFSATLYLVFRREAAWFFVLLAAFALFPITSFVLLQFPLLVDVICSTYGPGIFGKKSDRLLY